VVAASNSGDCFVTCSVCSESSTNHYSAKQILLGILLWIINGFKYRQGRQLMWWHTYDIINMCFTRVWYLARRERLIVLVVSLLCSDSTQQVELFMKHCTLAAIRGLNLWTSNSHKY
jgi:hypothetical protein